MFTNVEDEVCRLGSEGLTRVFRDTLACTRGIELEIVPSKRGGDPKADLHPAATVGLPWGKPVIQIADSLQDNQRAEAIAHEIGHLLLVYRFGLGMVGRRMPRASSTEEMFIYFCCMGRHWDYLLGQVTNTAHHLILIDYLREEYGIGSNFHLQLLHRHFQKLASEAYEDRESLYAQGLITFEYQRLGRDVNEAVPLNPPREEIWQSYRAAQKHFGRYHSQSIPSTSAYRNDILSLLEDLEYARHHFLFFPRGNYKEEKGLPVRSEIFQTIQQDP
jgi:hypothetical protein